VTRAPSGGGRDVCVIGAGPAGIAVALRAAKRGHRVVLLEAGDAAGGALRPRRVGDLDLDDGRGDMLLPAALRDLFRKSGRPLERELELTAVTGVRTVLQSPDRRLDLPLLGRGAQHAAVAVAFGEGTADSWTSTIDGFGRRWDAARRILENDPAPRLRTIGARTVRALGFPYDFSHELRNLRSSAGGDVLAVAAGWPLSRDGHDPDHAPAVLALLPYLEQTLGRWHPAGGTGALLNVMIRRLALRGVELRTGSRATGLLRRDDRVHGVRTADADVPADVVVSAVGVPATVRLLDGGGGRLARRLGRVRPAAERLTTFVRVPRERVPDAYETVLPGSPSIAVRPVPADVWTDPDANSAWVCLDAATGSGNAAPDLVAAAATRGVDLTPGLLERHDLAPVAWAASAGVTGWRVFGRLSPITPSSGPSRRSGLAGLLVAGRAAYLPGGLATELLSGALAAAAIDEGAGDSDDTMLA
jgi:phytoene dehydrogenase-like protein